MLKEATFTQPSVMSSQAHFSNVPHAEIPRSRFSRSHGHKTTFDGGLLIPIYYDEVLPGDTFNLSQTAFARLATPLKPIMDNLYLDTHYFFVPYRLIWDHWQQFMGQVDDPTVAPPVYTVPKVTFALGTIVDTDLAAYFGIPRREANPNSVSVNSLAFRAYNLIWNEWYRDENLQKPVTVRKGDTGDLPADYVVLRRNKRHDYFTSCLPWPQKGNAVSVPLGTSAVVKTGVANLVSGAQAGLHFTNANGTAQGQAGTAFAPNGYMQAHATAPGTLQNAVYPDNLYADLTSATSITINDLRSAFQIQKLLERDARGGTRYIELILSHFGVTSPDGRLQRPELLGVSTTRVSINPVASTVADTEAPQGNLAAVGTAVARGGFSKGFTEHGIIIGMCSARADLTYQQGIERFWFRNTRYDFYWPALAHLGEQAVLNREIYVSGSAADTNVFGYQERYAEYRYKPSRITGLFQSEMPASLDVWHLSQEFASLPVLNSSFIQDNPPIDRIIAVPAEPHFIADFWFDLQCDRPMPIYAVPGMIDHF